VPPSAAEAAASFDSFFGRVALFGGHILKVLLDRFDFSLGKFCQVMTKCGEYV